MKRLFKKYVEKKGLITTLIAGFVLAIAGWPLGFYSPLTVFRLITRLVSTVVEFSISLLKITFPIWAAILFVLIFYLGKRIAEYVKQKKADEDGFLHYREDVFNDVKYRWRYEPVKGKYSIVGIRAYCSGCDCHLPIIECPNPDCKKVYLQKTIGPEAMKNVVALVRYKLRTDLNLDEYERIK